MLVYCCKVMLSYRCICRLSAKSQLIITTEFDSVTQEVLEVLCYSHSVLLFRLVEDYLPSGTHYASSAQIIVETELVSKSNVVSEREFGKLDRLLREKLNASALIFKQLFCSPATKL